MSSRTMTFLPAAAAIILVLILSQSACGGGGGGEPTPADTAATPEGDPIAMHVEALGGRERLESVEVIHTVDSISLAGMAGFVESWWVREPFMGHTVMQAGPVREEILMTGDSVWSVDRNGHLTPGGAEKRREAEISRMTIFRDYLLDTTLVEVLGDTILPEEGEALVLALRDHDIRFYVSTESWLPVLETAEAMGMTVESRPSDWSEVDGLVFPMTTVSSIPAMGQEIVSENQLTEVDVPVPESLFVLSPGTADWELPEPGTPHPFRLTGDHIFLEGEVNGTPVTILLDSGAGATVLDSALADRLGLEGEGTLSAQGVAGTGEFSFVRLDSYSAAGATISDQHVAVMPLDDVFYPATGEHMGLILGYDFLSRFVTELDYGGRTITLHDPAGYRPPEGADIVPVERAVSLLSVDAVLEDSVPVRLLLDTGAGGNVHLTTTFVRDHPSFLEERQTFTSTLAGVGGEDSVRVFRLGSIALGDHRVPGGLSSTFPSQGPLSEYDGILGAGVLARFVLTLDYRHDRILLRPSDLFESGLPENVTGLGMEILGDVLVAGRVLPQSPAEEAGIAEGDTILAIDGEPVGPDDLSTIDGHLPQEPGRRVRITVRRGEGTAQLQMVTDRLLP